MLKKLEKSLLFLISISFFAYFVGTIIGNNFLMDLMSPVTIGFVLVLFFYEERKVEGFKLAVMSMATGLLLWFIGDIFFFCNDYVVATPGSLTKITDIIYLLPNAFFSLCISFYMIKKLENRRNDLAYLMINSLCFAIVGFVLTYRYYDYLASRQESFFDRSQFIFFFISFYTIMMSAQLAVFVGLKKVCRGTNLMFLGVFGYAVLDIEYNFMQSLGMDAENDYTNLIYVLFLILMPIGLLVQNRQNYVFEFIERDFSGKGTSRRFFICVVLMLVDFLFIGNGILPKSLGAYIIITLLSYLIVNYILHSAFLSEELIKYQKEQNAILEERIKEKTIDLEKANGNLKVLSTTDALTGLKNRRSSQECIRKTIISSKDRNTKFALIMADLNHFKPVNDTYGHEMGDLVLKEIGKRLNSLPQEFTAFRIGGDEFMVIIDDVKNQDQVRREAERIRSLFNTPIIFDTYIFNLSASMGIAIYPDDSEDGETLLNYADAVMYDVKKSSNKDGYKLFNSAMTKEITRKKAIQQVVKNAKADQDFLLYFQPQFDISSGKIEGVEVFPHLKGEMESASPAELMPIAEECGLISSLSIWIAHKAIETVAHWNKEYGQNIGFTLNLSPLQLLDAEFIETLEHLSTEYKFDTGKIILDISNEVIMGATGSAKETLEAFHKYGFAISLNDFGGKSINLSYLMDCGINYIQLSRNLISSVEQDGNTRVLIDSILKFASTMGITVTAVGIENEKQYEELKGMGITKMQGFLLGKPVKDEDMEKLIQNQAAE